MNKALRGTNRIKSLLRAAAVWSAAGILCALLFPGAFLRAYAAPGDSGEQPSTGADTVVIRVEGEIGEIDRGALVERLNAIRREACEEGIDNPVNGTPLSMNDYVPVEWSYALEEIAVLRAAESTILQDHVRPDGSDCFSAAPEGVSYTAETLAWGFGSAADALEGWYSEKRSYTEADGRPAGHYMALINPENRYVGIADVQAQWQRDACAGAFGTAASAQTSMAEDRPGSRKEWMIPLRGDLLPAAVERAIQITSLRIRKAAIF